MPKHSKKFQRDYDRAFKMDPLAANILLLLAELADKNGQVTTSPEELSRLLTIRFEDPMAYQLRGGRHD